MQKIFKFGLLCCFLCEFRLEGIVNLEIKSNYNQKDSKTFQCELTLSVPQEWKLSRAPYISILRSKNLKNFKYDENYEKLDETTYKTHFTIEVENEKIIDNQLELSVDCPICNKICTIVSKKINIMLNRGGGKSSLSIIFILLLGLLGGFILNFMPCVLPVIMMKLKSFESKISICGSIAGNYASFSLLAIGLAFLKVSGEIIGWGMHFQNPYFLEAITFILFCLTLYSFEIISFFPSMRIETKKYQIFWGNFISSMVASIVAIPCTAPFLGTAATFAIQGSISDLCWIFFAIATGFSIPYFISFVIPMGFLARFGRCSNILKKTINYGIMVTFLWIFWLLSNHLSVMATVMYALSFVVLTLLLQRRKYLGVAIVLGICFCCWMSRDFSSKTMNSSPDAIIKLIPGLANKQVILLNITADWCLTCKYNHRIFRNEKVINSMKNNNVRFIEGDMTRKNDTLMKIIENHNRAGIPFTIVYGPRAKNGIVLDEILTADTLVEAIENAK